MTGAVRGVLAILVLAVGLALGAHALGLDEHLSVDGMRGLVEAHEPYGPLVFIGICVAVIFLHLPEIVPIAIGGVVFGGLRGFAYGWIACLIGMTATFLIVRYLARDAVQRGLFVRFPRLRALDERLARHGFWTVLLLRVFLFAAPPLNWGLGATRVRLHHYVGGSALGVVPAIGSAVWFGDLVASREVGWSPLLLAGALLVVVLAAAVVVSRRLGGEQGAPGA